MAVFTYTASDAAAREVAGSMVADTPRQARDRLRAQQLSVHRLARQDTPRRAGWRRWLERSPNRRDVTACLRELATLLAVGTPLLEAIDTVRRGRKGLLGMSLARLRDRVAAGESLADAMAHQPAVFDAAAVRMAAIGAQTGGLDRSLDQLADLRERSAGFRNRLLSALLYPLIVAVVGLGVCLFLMTRVVPDLLATLIESGRPLPWVTQVVKAASDALIAHGLLGLVVAAALGALAVVLLSTSRGRWLRDNTALRTPLLGPLAIKQNVGRVAALLASLLRAGLTFEEAATISAATCGNRVVARCLTDAVDAIRRGRDIGPAMDAAGVLPPSVVHVFALGQASGRLDEMLDRLARDCDRDVEIATSRLTTLLEPALIVVLAVVVGAIAAATILPMLEMGHALG
ncbi:MAG: type II secretion system F family protein [Planctomycetota bacterium]